MAGAMGDPTRTRGVRGRTSPRAQCARVPDATWPLPHSPAGRPQLRRLHAFAARCGPCSDTGADWHRDCDDRALSHDAGASGRRPTATSRMCSLSFSCLAVCGLIPLSRAKESYGHAHGRHGEPPVGPWNRRRHSHRARLARPHAGAHEVTALPLPRGGGLVCGAAPTSVSARAGGGARAAFRAAGRRPEGVDPSRDGG
jgi:hypothetical protein